MIKFSNIYQLNLRQVMMHDIRVIMSQVQILTLNALNENITRRYISMKNLVVTSESKYVNIISHNELNSKSMVDLTE